MNDTLQFILDKFNPTINKRGGTEIHNINRTIMAETLRELDFYRGVEVGTAEGFHAEVLLNKNPKLFALTCIDPYVKYPGYEEYQDPESDFIEAKSRLPEAAFRREFSVDAVRDFESNSLDFVYIDAAHDFKNVAMDLCEWAKKVRIGGIVFGHDFKRSKKNVVDVKDVVPAYCYAKNIHPWFILTNDIKDPTFGRDNPGWMFVRQESDKL